MRTKFHRLAPFAGILLCAGLTVACNKLKARDQLNKGVMAFRSAHFPEAVNHFQEAVSLDPTLLNAKLFLATAYSQQYAPGGASPENLKMGDLAISSYEEVLKADPNNKAALGNIGQIYYEMQKFDKAKEYQERLLKIDPNNPETYYWIGVLDYIPCNVNWTGMRRDLNLLTPKDPKHPGVLPPLPEKARKELAEKNATLVDEGMQMLQKALQLKPNYLEAMAYLNLMYRQKADLETDNSAREADLKEADQWVDKYLDLRKRASQTQKSGA
ncbi:MAG: tetratricopeptide repeat protein [Terriglobia bacterium]